MATGFNRGIFIGNVVDAPVIRTYGDGKSLSEFKIAINRGKNETLFVKSTAFAGLGGVCAKYLKRGSSVLVESRVKVAKYTDKTGAKRQAAEIVIDNMTMLGEGSNAGLNTGVWIGTLGADPIVVSKPGAKTKVRFSIAINDPKRKNAAPAWIDVTGWEKNADMAIAALKKGSSVAIVGRLTSRTYERADGTKGDSVEIVMESFQRVGNKKDSKTAPLPEQSTATATSYEADLDDFDSIQPF
jgi:single-strand DNA-binding protein